MRIIVMVVCLVLGTGLTSNVIGGRGISDFDIDGVTSWILVDALNWHLKKEGFKSKIQKINDFEVVKQGQKSIPKGRENVYLISANVTLDNNERKIALSRIRVSRARDGKTWNISSKWISYLVSSKNDALYKQALAAYIELIQKNYN